MKKFVFLYVGSVEPTQETMDGWTKWFGSIGDKVVDSGNPFGAGKEISSTDTKELPLGPNAISGYSIINAESMDEAEKIAKDCPIITGVRIYEAMPM